MRILWVLGPVLLTAELVALPLSAQAARSDSLPPGSASLTSFALEGQVTAANPIDHGRAALVVGQVRSLGAGGDWRPQLGMGLTALFGQWVLDGVALGPRIELSRALPLGFIVGPREHQLLLGAAALVDGTWRFRGLLRDRGTRLEPAVRAALGYRFRPDGAGWYTVMRVLVEGRRHVEGPTAYISLGFETPR